MTSDKRTAMEVRIERVEAELSVWHGRFDRLDQKLDAIDRRLVVVEKKVDILDQRLHRVEISLEHMQDDVRTIAEGLVTLSERMDRQFSDLATEMRADRELFKRMLMNTRTAPSSETPGSARRRPSDSPQRRGGSGKRRA